jgi:AsmA protein
LPGGGFGRFALKALANVVGSTISLSGVNIELDGNAGEGVLSLAGDGRMTLQGTLAAEGLDLTPYISTVRLLATGQRDWDRQLIALDGFQGVDVDIRLSAARVNVAHVRFGRTAVAATLRGGNLNVTVGEAQSFGGLLKGSFGIAKSPSGADFKAQLQFADVELERCLGDLLGVRRLEGKGTLAFALESSGDNVYELTKALNGTANLTARKGAIVGFNVEQLLRRIERRPLSGSGEFRGGKTSYESLTVGLKIHQGTATVDEVRMDGPIVRIALGGSASIPDRELDLKGTASLLSSVAGTPNAANPSFELPFMVQGPWDDPIMLPDVQSRIQRSGAAQPLLETLRQRPPGDPIRSAIERLTGTRSSQPEAQQPPEAPALAGTASEPPAESTPAPEPPAEGAKPAR